MFPILTHIRVTYRQGYTWDIPIKLRGKGHIDHGVFWNVVDYIKSYGETDCLWEGVVIVHCHRPWTNIQIRPLYVLFSTSCLNFWT